jgi:DNA-binding MarR family transcriptional regulator
MDVPQQAPASGSAPPPPPGHSGDSPTRGVRPGDPRLDVWRAFLRAHAHLVRRLEQDLGRYHEIGMASYDVLVQLAEAPGRRLRMSELAEAVLLSRSGLTRLVDRLQKDGMVVREPDPLDARGMFTVLTTAGRDALREASVVHLAGVTELFLDRLTGPELVQLQELMSKVDPGSFPAGASPGVRAG